MEIRTLRYFLAVAREENMTRAAALPPRHPAHTLQTTKIPGERTGQKTFPAAQFQHPTDRGRDPAAQTC